MVGGGATQYSADELETPADDTPESCYDDLRNQRADGERILSSTRQGRPSSVPSDFVSEWNAVYNVFGFKFKETVDPATKN